MLDRREAILAAARIAAQARGYGGLNFRDLAKEVGITGPSIHYYFASKADLGAAVAQRYWQDSKARLDAIWRESENPATCLARYPEIFGDTLAEDNRMCLCGFMSAEYDDLPAPVRHEVETFVTVHVDWLTKVLSAMDPSADGNEVAARARAIYSAVGGAQLMARGQSNVEAFDMVIGSYRTTGLIPS